MVNLEDLKQSLLNGWSNIHPDLLTHLHSDRHYSDIQEDIITPHPHVRLVTHFADAETFSYLIKQVDVIDQQSQEELKPAMEALKKRCEDINETIKDLKPEELTANHILPYIDLLAHHIIVQGREANGKIRFLTRFGTHRINRAHMQSQMLQTLEDMYFLDMYSDDPESGGYRPKNTWHKVMTSCWAFLEGGFIEHSRFVIDTLTNATEKVQMHQPQNRIFDLWEAEREHKDYFKHLRSVYSIVGPFYAAIGETDKAIEAFKKSVELFDKIGGYTEQNRVVEHAIEVYNLQPTEENRLLAIDLFIKNKSRVPHENGESIRESGIVGLMMLQDIFKVVIP